MRFGEPHRSGSASFSGTVSLTNKAAAAVKANNSKYDDELAKLRAGLAKEVSDAAEGKLVHHRKKVHFCGGSAWAATTILFPEKVKEPFVKLTPQDFDRYAKMLVESKGPSPPSIFPRSPTRRSKPTPRRNCSG